MKIGGFVQIQLISDVNPIFNRDRLCVSQSITATPMRSAPSSTDSFDVIVPPRPFSLHAGKYTSGKGQGDPIRLDSIHRSATCCSFL